MASLQDRAHGRRYFPEVNGRLFNDAEAIFVNIRTHLPD